MSAWWGKVKAPQGAPIYTHEFDGESPGDILRRAADALDLTEADAVTVEMTRWDGSEWTPWLHHGHYLEVFWDAKFHALTNRVRCPQADGRRCAMDNGGCALQEELLCAGLEFMRGYSAEEGTTFALPLALEYRVRPSHGEDDDEFLEIQPKRWT